MKIMNVVISIVITMVYGAAACAVPAISSTGTSNLASGQVSITGSGFGDSGPTIILFDRFESAAAVEGEEIPLGSPGLDSSGLGGWSDDNITPPLYNAVAHSGNFSAQTFKKVPPGEPTGRMRQFKLDFESGIQEIFLSYWVRIPDGGKFPSGDRDLEPQTLPTDSAWKFTWLYDLDVDGNSSDVCLPTYTGQGAFQLAGNDFTINGNLGNTWWSWSSWMRISVWLRANPVDPTAPGDVFFQTFSSEKGVAEVVQSTRVFDDDFSNGPGERFEGAPDVKQYQHINFPGWMRPQSQETATPLYDDIYIATGSNSSARVELANSPDYDEAKKIAVQLPQSWSDTGITINVNQGDLENVGTDAAFLFVWDKDGNRNATGFPLLPYPKPPTVTVVQQ